MEQLPTPTNTDIASVIRKRRHWTDEEDEAVRVTVENSPGSKWAEISKQLEQNYGISHRTGKQCRERWFNHLSPEVCKQPWSPEEQSTLFKRQQELGNIWAHIAGFLPGRSENSVKNQYYTMLKRQYRKFKGGEPKNLKRYEEILGGQIIAALNKKLKQQQGGSKFRFEKVVVIEDFDWYNNSCSRPAEQQSENSTQLDEQDI